MVRPEGVEPPTYWFVASCSIQLSYGRTLRERQLSKDIGFRLVKQPIVCGKRLMIAGVMRCSVVRMARPSSWMVFKNS